MDIGYSDLLTHAVNFMNFVKSIKEAEAEAMWQRKRKRKRAVFEPDTTETDIYISFHAPDAQNAFTQLYDFLYVAGINVYRDSTFFARRDFTMSMFQAIKKSSICIAILSKNYASSELCLNELAIMMEMRKQLIIPVFFNIQPHKVRLQTGIYEKAFRLHDKTHDPGTVERWRKALESVASLTGWVLEKSDSSTHAMDSIVKEVVTLLNEKKSHRIGTDDKVEDIVNLLQIEVNDIRLLVIQGVGGVGKTTLAKIVFNQISNRFNGCAFLADVRETIKRRDDGGFQALQTRLLSDIQKRDCEQIRSVEEGIMVIGQTCLDIKVLIVLDDISFDAGFHLEDLIGKLEAFGPGSRIIVTTRSKHGIPRMACTYQVQPMPYWEASQLFIKHAFRGYQHPYDKKVLLSKGIVLATEGTPLIVEVLGSFLLDKTKEVWEDTLTKLRETEQVQEKLMISVQALDQQQKRVFLDIACFLHGEDSELHRISGTIVLPLLMKCFKAYVRCLL